MKMIIENLDNIDIELAKKILLLNYNHIGILERKKNELEKEIANLRPNPYEYDSDYGKF